TVRGSSFSNGISGSDLSPGGERRPRAGTVGVSEQATSAPAHTVRYSSRMGPGPSGIECEFANARTQESIRSKRRRRRERDCEAANVPRAHGLGMFCILVAWDSIDVGVWLLPRADSPRGGYYPSVSIGSIAMFGLIASGVVVVVVGSLIARCVKV